QVFLGISGGAFLALVALFLTIPRALIEQEAPVWLRDAIFGGDLPVVVSPEPAASESVEEPLPLEVEVPAAEGALVASLGEVGAAVDPELGDTDSLSDEGPELEPSAEHLNPDLYIGALSKQTIIRSRPDPDSPIIGFARTGALLRRAEVPA